jgi:hypothetical protein
VVNVPSSAEPITDKAVRPTWYRFFVDLLRRVLTEATDTVAGILETATQAEMESATATDKIVTPGRLHFHPGTAKFWAYATVAAGAPTLVLSYNVTSITDTAQGVMAVTIATDFSSANWVDQVNGNVTGTSARVFFSRAKAAGSLEAVAIDFASTGQDPADWSVVGFGDHA